MRLTRISLAPVFLLIIITLFSCQKEISSELGTRTSGTDSGWYISSIHSIDYDSLGVLIDSSADYFTYQDGQTIYKNVDHSFMYGGSLDSCQYTYTYDQNNRLTKLSTDYNTFFSFDVAKTILFTYNSNNTVF